MSLDLLWSVLEPKIYFSGILTKILAVWRKSAKPDTGSRFFVFAFRHLQIVLELPETISSSKTKSLDLFEIFTHWPQVNTVTNLPQIGVFQNPDFRVSALYRSRYTEKTLIRYF